MGGQDGINQYNNALSSVHRSLRRPMIQRSVFSFAKANPRELVRSTFNSSEIQQRAITHLPDELLKDIPQSSSPFSLLQGFNASLPDESDNEIARRRKRHGRHGSRGQKLLGEADDADGPPQLVKLKNAKFRLNHRLEMMGIRKTMCASEIREIDIKIANLNSMRKVVLDRLAGLEQEETDLEHEISEVANSLDVMQEEIEDEAALATKSPVVGAVKEETKEASTEDSPSFMSESIYEKLPAARAPKRRKNPRRISMPILHEHLEPGSRIREIQAHNDLVTALDFDAPFGTMVTAALDDTVRVWDLNAGRCMGLLEGHLSSVRCLQVEDNLVATGSMDASIRLWDLSQADYNPPEARNSDISKNTIPEELDEVDPDQAEDDDGALYSNPEEDAATPPPRADAMADCALFTLSSHVAEVTALNMRGNTLVSGSADKTLRQWDLETGRCVQTLDVLWAAAQAETLAPPAAPAQSDGGWWRPTSGRLPAAEADFVGAVQVFDAALACGTADGMVRLWDLRSGMVHRSLVGHTGPVTALQFDDMYLVTGSMDRSIRVSRSFLVILWVGGHNAN